VIRFLSHSTMLWHMWTIHLCFSSHCIMYNFSSVLIVFEQYIHVFQVIVLCNFSSVLIVLHWIFNWIALDDVDLWLTHFVKKKPMLISFVWLYHHCNQSIHMTNDMTVTLLPASLQHKSCQGLCMPNGVKPKIIMWI
jgi:hypothetical protein